jgi:hypothetical protein
MKKVIILIFAIVFAISCSESISDSPYENQPPETSIFLYPDSLISPQPSKLTIGWWADDPDGLVIGYYYKWNGSNWEFTIENEISFELQIGESDTLYRFEVIAVDNNGNNSYDNSVVRNGINFGAEPFEDNNGDGIFNLGEVFFDIGDVDPEPATQDFPIKNSAPTIEWNSLTSIPEESFPVMTFGWNVDDLDGLETIRSINLALNDTSDFISLDGDIRNITIRAENFDDDTPLMEIISNGNLSEKKLPGIILNSQNIIYVQVEDISGAKSNFLKLPSEEESNWYVHKPKGKVLLIDDNTKVDNSENFYKENLDNLLDGTFLDKYDTWDIHKYEIPYENITFSETIKLFDALIWYSDNQPNIDLASGTLNNYIQNGGKVIFSSVLPHPADILQLQDFLPVDSLASPIKFLGSNLTIVHDSTMMDYPDLMTTGNSIKVQALFPSEFGAKSLYLLPEESSEQSQVIGLKSNDNKIFFFGLPLHECDGIEGNVKILLEKILFDDFGLSL